MESVWRENPWKVSTIVLLGFVLLLLIESIIDFQKQIELENKNICLKIKGTPAWINEEKEVIYYGLLTKNNSNINFSNNLINFLIENKIKLVYSSECPYCKMQIDIFGEENWKKYNKLDMAINCSKYKK